MENDNQNNVEELKKEIDQIKADYNKAKWLLDNVQNISKLFDEVKIKTELASNEIISTSEKIKPRSQEIEEIKNETQNRLNEISTNLDKVKNNIVSMQEAYTQFSEIKGKIDGRSGEIENLLQNANGLKNDIEVTKNEAQKVIEAIKNSFAEVQKKVQEMQTAYEVFLQIKGKIDDEKTGLTAVFNAIQDFKTKTETIHKEIQSYRDESKQLLESIRKNNNEANIIKDEMEGNLDFTNEKKREIENATGLIIDTSFAETFEKRKREIEAGLNGWKSWKVIFFISIIFLALVVIIPFIKWNGLYLVDFNNDNVWRYLINRIFIATPLVFLIGFSASQYTKERDFAEKYAFKASSSAAIRSHIEFLLKNFNKQEEMVANFAKQAFSTIYKQPYEDNIDVMEKRIEQLESDLKESKRQKSTKDLDLSIITDSVKELKSLIPDESLLKNIIHILVRK